MKLYAVVEIDLGDNFCDWDDAEEREWGMDAVKQSSQIRLGNDVDDDYPCRVCCVVGGLGDQIIGD